MKISKKQLNKLVKEAIKNQLNEGGADRFDKLDMIREFMDDTDILEELVRMMSDSEWNDYAKTIIQYHGGDPDYGVWDEAVDSRNLNEDLGLVTDIALGVVGGIGGIYALKYGLKAAKNVVGSVVYDIEQAKLKKLRQAENERFQSKVEEIASKFKGDATLQKMLDELNQYPYQDKSKRSARNKQLKKVNEYVKSKLSNNELDFVYAVNKYLRNKGVQSEAAKAGKTEHSGAKKGKGAYYGKKKDAKKDSKKKRRENDKKSVNESISSYDLNTKAILEEAAEVDDFKSAPVKLGYDAWNIFSRYWMGQGDPLYAVLSRRGDSVDIETVEASEDELSRLIDVAEEASQSDDRSEQRVGMSYLPRFEKTYNKNFGDLEEKLDPVGKADLDIDNDGDYDSSDSYLRHRRRVRTAAVKGADLEKGEPELDTDEVLKDALMDEEPGIGIANRKF